MRYAERFLSRIDKQRAAEFLSIIFAPQIVSFISFLFISLYLEQSIKMKIISAFTTISFTSIFPSMFVYYLLYKGKIDHPFVPERERRTIPYFFAVLSAFVGFLILLYFKSHWLILASQWCYVSNTFLILLINSRWKISAHSAGLSGPLSVLAWIFGYKAMPLFLLIPLVGWSRLYLRAHSFWQVVGGAVLGIVSTFVQIYLFSKIFG
ncbi:PAP2 superfamily protein [Candidatus Kryptonium thompsonii]|jgi:membrane-associated phospholipid phosphatase|uniref:PAP2 superfamily protein n=1 Tax=Candidatus Kryptonium thompsonii TaxID=1633631 RepID=A0A0P1LKZ7_9BACT|nr:phosphatase PAP2 family protein [Candidatus Kryptonium thompsoni]CUS78464.1 PAP2 superfamily protein [Candidatus Kryptonium thompsoni]CUS79762.1 PAP2 superfamily protein [Candidatus Kryptonium thompsoni]CUS84619.1 PAP2 superfamily protein [Candidatus Kryptonium thompsoni]CUS85077.1 PAP2 superfamily protein [Candidatus Kryptonium thompsoni]CUS85659.1 PAP2 superfamily protein [Candidatus Kryptonium thompsoni]